MPDDMKVWERDYISEHRVARLSTVGKSGQPHLVPIVYAFDGQFVYTPLDEKPKEVGATRLQRVQDIQGNPQVAVLVDDYFEEWERLAWVQVRGAARLLSEGPRYQTGLELLMEKYPQYQDMPLEGRPLIVIEAQRVISWKGS